MSVESEWLIPFRGRGESEYYSQNFVWKKGNIYVMDNHRAASWCWCQHIHKDEEYNLLHIDAHYDSPPTYPEDDFVRNCLDPWTADLNAFLDCSYRPWACPTESYPCLRCDNYLSLFVHMYPDVFKECVFATHVEAGNTEPSFEYDRVELQELPRKLDSLFTRDHTENPKWICNVDLDYFFFRYWHGNQECFMRMFATPYIEHIFTLLKKALDNGRIIAFTMALSPEWCGGWKSAEGLAAEVCRIMDVPFGLPTRD